MSSGSAVDNSDIDMQDKEMQGMNMPGMNMSHSEPDGLPSPHISSGTGWQPAATPELMWMRSEAAWDLMAHGVVFVDYNQQGGPRGEGKAESVNWLMLMEQHKLGRGSILFREMFSAESLTSPHPGFPELFQTGETYHGQPLVDHQHPHNVFSELALYYTQTNRDETFLAILRRGCGRAGVRSSGLYAPRFGVGVAHGAVGASFAGFHAHQLRSAHHWVVRRPFQA